MCMGMCAGFLAQKLGTPGRERRKEEVAKKKYVQREWEMVKT